ncbi:MAG TPA: integron integrase [Ramlibacter sp.]|jgi:integron integrase|uniref:integron integrase n=1 Tax=Ramlibacter sp. TaxID=1917967 RepID=UPI002D226715|nr:integron integrase [Ramlibacter sp.]HZY17511.1 integron integrase [Ramlibacter sp.]
MQSSTPHGGRPQPRLLDQVRERARYLHYSLSTEKAYLHWVRFFIRWHGLKHPADMGAREVEAFLSMLAAERKVSSSTHNQALSALLFLYREVLAIQLPWMQEVRRPAYSRRIPAVLTREEVAQLLAAMPTDMALVARLLYGTGMRLMEALRLRVKDVDFARHVIVVREAKGNKDRVVMLPRSLSVTLHAQVLAARRQWESDRGAGRGGVAVPHALEAKYPHVGASWGWFWIFPSPSLAVDPRTGVERRHHLYEDRLKRALRKAVAAAGPCGREWLGRQAAGAQSGRPGHRKQADHCAAPRQPRQHVRRLGLDAPHFHHTLLRHLLVHARVRAGQVQQDARGLPQHAAVQYHTGHHQGAAQPGAAGQRQRGPRADDGHHDHQQHQSLRHEAARQLGVDDHAEAAGRQPGAEVVEGDMLGQIGVVRLGHGSGHLAATSAKASGSALRCSAHMSA